MRLHHFVILSNSLIFVFVERYCIVSTQQLVHTSLHCTASRKQHLRLNLHLLVTFFFKKGFGTFHVFVYHLSTHRIVFCVNILVYTLLNEHILIFSWPIWSSVWFCWVSVFYSTNFYFFFQYRGLNLGSHRYKASTLPLQYIIIPIYFYWFSLHLLILALIYSCLSFF